MLGTDIATGKSLDGLAHVKQSVRDILTTPKGSRVMRRTYGSDLFALTDRPLNLSTRMDIVAATADALALWEPRIQVTKVDVSGSADGRVTIDLSGVYLVDGSLIRIDGIVVH